MRLTRIAFVVATLALVLGACASATPGWTFAPGIVIPTAAPSVSSAASPGSSEAASPGSSEAGSPVASGNPAASSAASAAPGGTALKVTAKDIAFDPTSLTATANAAFQITFDNQDQGIPHNIDIKDGSGTSVFKGDLVTGPNTATYNLSALPAGDYTFVCDVHSNMTGTLSVK